MDSELGRSRQRLFQEFYDLSQETKLSPIEKKEFQGMIGRKLMFLENEKITEDVLYPQYYESSKKVPNYYCLRSFN